jgi:hypothetical protein
MRTRNFGAASCSALMALGCFDSDDSPVAASDGVEQKRSSSSRSRRSPHP